MTKIKLPYIIILIMIFAGLFIRCEKQPSQPHYDNPLDEMNPQTGGDPFNLNAQIGAGGIILWWNILNIDEIEKYDLYRKVDNGEYTIIFQTEDTYDSTYTDTAVTNGHLYTYNIVAVDNIGNQINSNVTEVEVNNTPILSIDDQDGYSLMRDVNLTLLAFAAAMMRIGAPDFTSVVWEEYAASKPYNLPAGEEEIVIQAQFAYSNGDTSDIVSDTTRPFPMNPNMVINNDSTYTSSKDVMLTMNAQGALWVRVSNDSASLMNQAPGGIEHGLMETGIKNAKESTSDNEWIPYSDTLYWQLDSGEGEKYVYVEFKNDFELIEETLDTILPLPMEASFTINHDSSYTSSRMVSLHPEVQGEGIKFMFSQDTAFTGETWSDFTDSLEFQLTTGAGAKFVYGRFKNDFEIVETAEDFIYPLPMNSSLTINHGEAYTPSTLVWVFPQAEGANLQYKLSLSEDFSGIDWSPIVDSVSFALPPGLGEKTIYGIIKNDFQIESTILSDSIEPMSINNLVEIAGDSQFVNHQIVDIMLPGEGALEVKTNNSPDSTSISWQPFQQFLTGFDLGTGDGYKYAYAWFRNDFYVSGPESDSVGLDTYCAIDTFYWTSAGGDTLVPGDLIHFHLTADNDYFGAESAGTALLNLPGAFQNLELNDNFNGAYSLDYTIQADDNCIEGLVTANFIDKAGNQASPFTSAQPITILTYWETTLGTIEEEMGYGVLQTDDGGYIVAGEIGLPNSPDILLIKTDANGNEAWTQTIDEGGDEEAYSICPAYDGGYMLCGYTNNGSGGMLDVLLVKTNSNGNKEWSQTYGGGQNDRGYSVIQDDAGGYVITGYTFSYGGGNNDIWLIKVDDAGNMEWNRTFGGSNYEIGYCVQQTTDGGYVIAGKTSSATFGYVRLIKTDSLGNQEWVKSYLGSATSCGYGVVQTADGGYMITGSVYTQTPTSSSDICVIKTDAQGNLIWSDTFGDADEDIGYSVASTLDGYYVIGGVLNDDVWLRKINLTGNEIWTNTYGGSGFDECRSVFAASDGGCIAAGSTDSFSAGDSDVYLIKTNP